MYNRFILPLFGISIIAFLGFQRVESISIEQLHSATKYSAGSPGSYTGAPGESTCTACHSGSVNDGSNENLLDITFAGIQVTEYTPNQTLDLTLTTVSNVAKKGFQITALDENNNPAGVFIASANTKLLNGSGLTAGRKYATHTSGTNSTSGWIFSWTAPASPVGEVTFYIATNKTNASGTTNGDVIYLSQHFLSTTAGLIEKTKNEDEFMVGFSPANNQIFVNFEQEAVGEMYINIVDMQGKSVYTQNLGKSIAGKNKQKIVLPFDLADGMHSVNFFVDNKVMSGKILIAR